MSRRLVALLTSCVLVLLGLGVVALPAAAATGPDLVLRAHLTFPEDGPAPVPIDPVGGVDELLFLDNDGDTSVRATLGITLTGFDPASLVVEPAAGGPAIRCTVTADGASCPVPPLAAGPLSIPDAHDAIWSLRAGLLPGATTGDVPAIALDLEPTTGTDANPADNAVDQSFVVKATADLQAAITPAPAVLVAGTPATFTLGVVDHGPETATTVRVAAILQTNDAGFTVRSADPAIVVTTRGDFSTVSWTLGALAAGATATTTFTVTAAAAGLEAAIGVNASSDAYDPVQCYDLACSFDATSLVTTVAAGTPTPDPTPGDPTTGPTGDDPAVAAPVLAVTGSDDLLIALTGIAMVLAGTGVVIAGRRRRNA